MFKTGNGPDAGEEEEFPEADNHAKLKRSIDNAEHVGLYFPPSPGHSSQAPGPPLPPPRCQRPGGRYLAPAEDRVAIRVIKELAILQSITPTSDTFTLSPSSSQDSTSPTSEHLNPSISPLLFKRVTDTKSAGLYAPREGQAYRERQRRQLSQFDRGTPPAIAELATYPDRLGSVTPRASTGFAINEMAFRTPYQASGLDPAIQYSARGVRRPGASTPFTPAQYLNRAFPQLML